MSSSFHVILAVMKALPILWIAVSEYIVTFSVLSKSYIVTRLSKLSLPHKTSPIKQGDLSKINSLFTFLFGCGIILLKSTIGR